MSGDVADSTEAQNEHDQVEPGPQWNVRVLSAGSGFPAEFYVSDLSADANGSKPIIGI
ncbi:hypothetical protein UY3_13851 [Chelonia mydas]|uniref:Uncharacterized protein n=1 Tax=Chelonia mydas TaxID=8469 RepID=M7AUC0_CHEMY|nr:hypothetical protein UY3_13851 [Chelonia mydas]